MKLAWYKNLVLVESRTRNRIISDFCFWNKLTVLKKKN
jgi:hypothetical protein